MRIAVKTAYDGSGFHGSQRQGDDDPGSVEGAIAAALRKVGQFDEGDKWPVSFSSRTDSGVSALGNVFALETSMDPFDLLRALNANMDGIWCWGWGPTRPAQNIRWANNRWYRYHLPPGTISKDGIDELNSILSIFWGEHDFTNFCRLESEKNPVTQIERIEAFDLSGSGDLVVIDVVGSRFLWNQIRRMVGAALSVVDGSISREDLGELLESGDKDTSLTPVSIKTMSPFGLVLMDVLFKDIEFQIAPQALEVALKRSQEESWKASMKVLLNTALRSLGP